MCRFHVVADTGSAPCQRQWHQPSEDSLPPTGPIKPWFLTEGNLAAVLIIPSSWGLPTRHGRHHEYCTVKASIKEFLAPLPGRKKLSARGVSHSQSLYFVFVLLCLFYPKFSNFDVLGYTDADYEGFLVDRKSTSGMAQFVGDRKSVV